MDLPEPVPFPRFATPAMLGLVLAGVSVGACGLQLLVFLQLPNAIAWTPLVLVALGAASLLAAVQLNDGRFGPSVAAAALAGVSFGLVSVVSVFLLLAGVFSPLFLVTPVFTLGALVMTLIHLPDARRYAAAQAALARAFAAQSAGASDAMNPFAAGPPPTSMGVRLVAVLVALLVVGWLPFALLAPVAFNRFVLQAQLLAHATWPAAAANLAPRAARSPRTADAAASAEAAAPPGGFPYASSPFLDYLAYERRFVDFDDGAIASFADRVAEDVGWQMLVDTGAGDVGEAERALWSSGRATAIPLWIADALRSRGVFYHLESLLSHSFDPWRHSGEAEIHMDCDQLVHLFEHVAWRLDLGMFEVQSPMHEYLGYRPPAGVDADPLYVETTAFRRVDVSGGRVDYMGESIGEDFFIPEDYHSSGKSGIRASRAIIAAAGLYAPSVDHDVQDSIVANVMAGLAGEADLATPAPIRAELEAHLDGPSGPTRSYLIVSNLHGLLLESATAALDAGAADPAASAQLDVAVHDAREAGELRSRFPHLLLDSEPDEGVIEARALLAQGKDAGPVVSGLAAWFEENASLGSPPTASSAAHAETLLLVAAVDGTPTPEACDRTYGAVLRYSQHFRSVPWADRLCAQLRAAPACGVILVASACS